MGQVSEEKVPEHIENHRSEVVRRVRAVGEVRGSKDLQEVANMIGRDDSFLDENYDQIAEALTYFENHSERMESRPETADPNGYEGFEFGK